MATSRNEPASSSTIIMSKLTDISAFLRSYLASDEVKEASPRITLEMTNTIERRQLVAKILSTLFGVGVSFALTYIAVKWMTNAMDPTGKEKKKAQQRAREMLKRLGVTNVNLTDYELCIASNLVDPVAMKTVWDEIGGLEEVVESIKETVIFPFRRADLFSTSSLIQAPKGVLLYGPPGCGKTMIARATAKAAGARFINLQISSLVDKWYGESQKRAEAVFTLALKLQPVIIFIDEIDSFLRSRSSSDHEATAMIKTQFMSFWDGLITDPSCKVMIIGATNRPEDVDAAILRRMPCMFKIGMPGRQQRSEILSIILANEEIADIDYPLLGEKTEGFSGSDLKEACRIAAINTVHEFIQKGKSQYGNQYMDRMTGRIRNLTMADVEYGVDKVRESKRTIKDSISMMQLD
ncbi:hypothetical protein CHS0354_011959 [Potamilus streckersoni]|uniref:AAA+ ATPase domain-containing protein n=1 Tax=Potamilus streckersoni TaxID=2493646 RepID=A0AAE0TAH4_9BIVA|nr:hypothetical protein CHS0354_011959 [Potamilus streckersoni]